MNVISKIRNWCVANPPKARIILGATMLELVLFFLIAKDAIGVAFMVLFVINMIIGGLILLISGLIEYVP